MSKRESAGVVFEKSGLQFGSILRVGGDMNVPEYIHRVK